MTTLKIYYNDYITADGFRSISLRLTHKRKHCYIPVTRVPATMIGKNGKVKDQKIQHMLDNLYVDYTKRILDLGFITHALDVNEIKDRLIAQQEQEYGVFRLDFIDWWENEYIPQQKDPSRHKTALKFVKQYVNGEKLDILDITRNWVESYYNWLTQYYDIKSSFERNISHFQRAYKECRSQCNKDVLRVAINPFEGVELPKLKKMSAERSERGVNAITPETMKRIIDCEITDNMHKHSQLAKDMFVLSFYCMGVNASDLYLMEVINKQAKDGATEEWLTYTRRKTKGYAPSHLEMKIEPCMAEIIERYKPKKQTNLALNLSESKGSYLTWQNKISDGLKSIFAKVVNDYAKEMNIDSFKSARELNLDRGEWYTARRTWASIAYNNCNIPVNVVDKCLGHVAKSVADVHYIRDDYSQTEQAKKAVIKYMQTI